MVYTQVSLVKRKATSKSSSFDEQPFSLQSENILSSCEFSVRERSGEELLRVGVVAVPMSEANSMNVRRVGISWRPQNSSHSVAVGRGIPSIDCRGSESFDNGPFPLPCSEELSVVVSIVLSVLSVLDLSVLRRAKRALTPKNKSGAF